MADTKSRAAQNARRIAEWFAQNQSQFEEQGVDEKSVAAALGIGDEEVTEAIDYLENREEVVRFPHLMETPPQILLKPGRGWPDMRDEITGKGAAGSA